MEEKESGKIGKNLQHVLAIQHGKVLHMYKKPPYFLKTNLCHKKGSLCSLKYSALKSSIMKLIYLLDLLSPQGYIINKPFSLWMPLTSIDQIIVTLQEDKHNNRYKEVGFYSSSFSFLDYLWLIFFFFFQWKCIDLFCWFCILLYLFLHLQNLQRIGVKQTEWHRVDMKVN